MLIQEPRLYINFTVSCAEGSRLLNPAVFITSSLAAIGSPNERTFRNGISDTGLLSSGLKNMLFREQTIFKKGLYFVKILHYRLKLLHNCHLERTIYVAPFNKG